MDSILQNADLKRRVEEAEGRARDAETTTSDLIRESTDANQRMKEAEARAQESTQALAQAEQRATQAEQRAAQAEQRAAQAVTQAEQRAAKSDQRATQAEQRATHAEQRAAQSDQRAAQAEHRATQADHRATQAEQRATQVEQRAAQSDQRAAQAEQRATQADHRATQAEQRATQAEQRATQSETGVHFLQQQNEEMAVRVRQAEQTAREAQERARMTEQRAQGPETRGHDQFWVVKREEIQLTDQELGRGGWAVVRVAKFRGLQVAAKCLHTLIISDYNRQLFVREMRIAARVHHPNLVQFIGATMDGEAIILTELMATSLRAVLERRPFNPAQITSISLDVARALNYLHLMHPDPIIHRDISSVNVLLKPGPNNSWRAKVSDYGSANFLQQLRTAGPGNPTYAAPEADNPSQQSPKMDVYSYGVLVLEMCSRRFPNPEQCEALLQQVQQPAMVALIRQCMKQEPMRRPTMSDIIRQLE